MVLGKLIALFIPIRLITLIAVTMTMHREFLLMDVSFISFSLSLSNSECNNDNNGTTTTSTPYVTLSYPYNNDTCTGDYVGEGTISIK